MKDRCPRTVSLRKRLHILILPTYGIARVVALIGVLRIVLDTLIRQSRTVAVTLTRGGLPQAFVGLNANGQVAGCDLGNGIARLGSGGQDR